MKIIECVPNISEGRDKQVIEQIVSAIKTVNGVSVLDVDPGFDTNRTVITFVGGEEEVLEGAFQCIKKSYELIDMSKHKGEHPRQGCTDVCPFIPVANASMDDCVKIANKLAEKVWKELSIPVYLYGYSAKTPERENLAFVRKGEYEGLAEKFKTLKPDFGGEYNEIVKKAGAINISARDFLIAYNVNLNTRDKSFANEIAFNVREAGRAKRDKDNNIVKDEKGVSVKIPGKLKAVKGIGWYIEEYGIAQVSFNLTNYHITPLYKLFETCIEEADKLGVRVIGSELVGLVPKETMLEVGKYFLKKAKRSYGVPERELIHIAVQTLGLSNFNIDEKIIEYKIEKEFKLNNMKLKNFIDEVGKDSPAPGGGSVSALAGALGAGLGTMVVSLSAAKKGFEHTLEKLSKNSENLSSALEFLKKAIDLDTEAFNDVMAAMRMSKNTEEEILLRNNKIQEGYKKATLVPFETAKTCLNVLENLVKVAELGNPNSISDVGVGALVAYAGFEGAILNVNINLPSIEDNAFKEKLLTSIEEFRNLAVKNKDKILGLVNEKI